MSQHHRRPSRGRSASGVLTVWLVFALATGSLVTAIESLEGLRVLLKNGRYGDAESGARAVLAELEGRAGSDSPEYAQVLDVLVEALWRGGKAKAPESRELAERAVRIKQTALGPDHPELATSLNNLASLLRIVGEYGRARPLLERGLEIREKALGPEHPEVAVSLYRLANLLVSAGDYGDARGLFERSLAIREKALGPEHPETAASLSGLGDLLYKTGDPAAARGLFERALAIRERSLGPEHPDVAVSLSNLATVLVKVGDYDRARPLFERALGIRQKALGGGHPDVAATLSSLAAVLRDTGEHAGARRLYERALEIREKALGPEHPQVAETLDQFAILLRRSGDYVAARPRLERALAIRQKALRPGHPDVAESLNSLGSLLREMGELAESRSLYERALEIREKALGPDHPDVAASLTNLAGVLVDLGDYTAARPLLERALGILESKLGGGHLDVASSLTGLANLLRLTGDYSGARSLHERALEIRQRALGPDHAEVGFSLQNLALLLWRADRYAEAEAHFERALATLERALGAEHPEVAGVLQNRAGLLRDTGRLAEARSLYARALAIQEKVLGREHLDVATCLSSFAILLHKTREYASATSLSTRALAIREKALGLDHPRVAFILNELARLRSETGRPKQALEASLRAERIGREQLLDTLRTLPERQALRYASERISSLDVALSLAADGLDPPSRRAVWDARIRARALVLDEMARRHGALEDAGRPEVARLAAALVAARVRLASLLVRGPLADGAEPHRRAIEEARREKEQAERALAERSAAFRQEQAAARAGLDEVAAVLAPGSALLAFSRYEHRSSPRYLAFVLRGGAAEPVVVPLGGAADIDALVGRFTAEAVQGLRRPGRSSREAEEACRAAGEELRVKVWDPVAARVGAAKRVFVVLDGPLHLLNLGALPVGRDGYLIEKGPLLHYLSAERDLVEPGRSGTRGSGLLALGGPAYDEPSSSPTGGAAPPPKDTAPVDRGETSKCAAFETLRFPPLPESTREAEEIAALWRSAAGSPRPATLLTGGEATEAAFKLLAPGRRVLHLATHGFFLGGRCPSAFEATRGVGGLSEPGETLLLPVSGESPLILSGLAMAGANRRTVSRDREDGILTAEEIAAMDLSGVEWAVLSACNTGIGEVQTGEGVLGLRRAFQVAGAGTLIMSLWPVYDVSAREWMRALYEARLSRGLDTAEAVREASLRVLHDRRGHGQSTHPFYWASFVATGDWR